MPVSANNHNPTLSSSNLPSQLQAYSNSRQESSASLFSSNLINDPAMIYRQQLQRSLLSTKQQPSNYTLYDNMQCSFPYLSPTNNTSYFSSNISIPQQKSDDIMTRLTQAMQTHDKQHQEKFEEKRHLEQQRRHEIELERLKLFQQVEQARLQHEEEERRKQELTNIRQINFDQLAKAMSSKDQASTNINLILAYQRSVQYQKEQQAKIQAQQ